MKRNNILYIDLLTSSGHLPYNEYQINAFKALGLDVWIICREPQASYFRQKGIKVAFVLDERFYSKHSHFNRLYLIWIQLKIYHYIRTHHFEYVVIGSYDTITQFLMPLTIDTFIINHVNPTFLDNPIKLLLTNLISNRAIHVALNEDIKSYLASKLATKRVICVPHGFSKKNKINCAFQDRDLSLYHKIIFCPSVGSSDIHKIESLLLSTEVLTFLHSNNYLLILKGDYKCSQSENILCIHRHLSKEEYDDLFIKSDLILIWYNESFQYRVSGVLFECIGNNKVASIADIPSMRSYEMIFNYNPYINLSIDEIDTYSVIDHFQKLLNIGNEILYINTNKVQPKDSWNQAFKRLKRTI